MKQSLRRSLFIILAIISTNIFANCIGYSGPGGGAYTGPGGGAYAGPGGPCSSRPGGRSHDKWNRPSPYCK
jgi:hypothetical protein